MKYLISACRYLREHYQVHIVHKTTGNLINRLLWWSHITVQDLTLRSIGKSGFRILQSKTENRFHRFHRFHLREIRPQGGFQLRNPNPDFMDFLFTVRWGNPKKGLAKLSSWTAVFFLLIIRARASPLFLRTVFQNLLRISQSNGKNENPETDISALKSVFGFHVGWQIRNRDFKI